MKTWIIILCTTCIFPCVGFSSESWGSHLQTADSLFRAEKYDAAALTYERIVYNASDNRLRTTALLGKARCHVKAERISAAENACLRINYFGLEDSLHFEARYATALYAYLNKDFEQAASQLLLVEQFLPEQMSMRTKPLYALSLNELRKWNEAKAQMDLWVAYTFQNDSAMVEEFSMKLDELYKPRRQPKYRDPTTAFIWASILPGTGQLYSWYPFDAAFTAVMVLSGFAIAAYGIFVVQYYVTGVLLGYLIGQQFYTSGQRRSKYLAEKRNYKSKRKYNRKLNAFILSTNEKAPSISGKGL